MLAIISLLSTLAGIVGKLLGMKSNQQLIDAGKAEQTAEAEQKARRETEAARAEEARAKARHEKVADDGAFDQEFRRRD